MNLERLGRWAVVGAHDTIRLDYSLSGMTNSHTALENTRLYICGEECKFCSNALEIMIDKEYSKVYAHFISRNTLQRMGNQ